METTTLERRSRSYSQYSDLLRCGWAYKLKRVNKIPETPSVWLAGGKAFHSTTEELDLEMTSGDLGQASSSQTWRDEIIDAYREAFLLHFEREVQEMSETNPDISQWRTAGRPTQDKPHGEDLDWWHANGQDMVQRYVEWRIQTSDTWEIATVEGRPAVEVEIKTHIGDTPTRHFVDRLLTDKRTGQLLVMDLKTGSRTPTSPMQLGVYGMLLTRKLGQPVKWGAYYDARRGTLGQPMALDAFTEDSLAGLFQSLDETVTQGLFLPNIDWGCAKCSVRTHCKWVGGTDPDVSR